MCVCGWMVTIPLLEGVLRDAIARLMVILLLERVFSTRTGVLRDAIARLMVILLLERVFSTRTAIDRKRVLLATLLLDTNSAQTHGTEIRR